VTMLSTSGAVRTHPRQSHCAARLESFRTGRQPYQLDCWRSQTDLLGSGNDQKCMLLYLIERAVMPAMIICG
jgi:hypothetical protein